VWIFCSSTLGQQARDLVDAHQRSIDAAESFKGALLQMEGTLL
jgi:hypothetical protein